MSNYFTDECFEKTSKSAVNLYLTERFTEYSFSYIANKHYGQKIPMDYSSVVNFVSFLKENNNPQVTFFKTENAYQLFKTAYTSGANGKEVLLKNIKPFLEDIVKIPNISLENGGIMYEILNRDSLGVFFPKLLKAQKKYFDVATKNLKKAGINIPLGLLNQFEKMGYDGSNLSLSVNYLTIKGISAHERHSKGIIEWFKTVKEQHMIFNMYENKDSINVVAHNDYKIEDWENRLKKHPEDWEYYQNYSSLPLNYNLDDAIKSFLTDYSASNLNANMKVIPILVNMLSELPYDSLQAEDNLLVSSFIKKHCGSVSFVHDLSTGYADFITKRDYSNNEDAFYQDIRVISNILSYQGLFEDIDKPSDSKKEKMLENTFANISDFLESHKEIILKSEESAQLFLEAIAQGSVTNSIHNSYGSCWKEAVDATLNNEKDSISSVIFDVTASANKNFIELINLNSLGEFDSLIKPLFDNLERKLFRGSISDKEHIEIIRKHPGVLGCLSKIYHPVMKYYDNKLLKKDLLSAIMADNSKNERVNAIDDYLSQMSASELKKSTHKQAIFNHLITIRGSVPFLENQDSFIDKQELVFECTKNKLVTCLNNDIIDLQRNKAFPLYYSDYSFRKKIKSGLNDVSLKGFSESFKTLMVANVSEYDNNKTCDFILSVKDGYHKDDCTIDSVDKFVYAIKMLSTDRANLMSLRFNMKDRDPEVISEEIFKEYSKFEGTLPLIKFLKCFAESEYIFNQNSIMPIVLKKNESIENTFNSMAVLRYLEINNNSFPLLEEINKNKDNRAFLSHALCFIANALDKGNLGRESDYGFIKLLSPLQLNITDMKEAIVDLHKRNNILDPVNCSIWKLPYLDRSFLRVIDNNLPKICSFVGIPEKDKNDLMDFIDDINKSFILSYAKDPKEYVTLLFDNKFKDLAMKNLPVVKGVYAELLVLAERNKESSHSVRAFEDVIKVQAGINLNNQERDKIINEIRDIKEKFILRKTINNKIVNIKEPEDSEIDSSTINSFKI